jgi:hypothetical protein
MSIAKRTFSQRSPSWMDSKLAASRDNHRFWASLAPPLAVAIIVASGLIWLAFVNPRGGAEPQTRFEHAAAIQRLFFRDSR